MKIIYFIDQYYVTKIKMFPETGAIDIGLEGKKENVGAKHINDNWHD